MKNWKKIISWAIVVFIMFIIFYFSHQGHNDSSSTSSALTLKLSYLFNLNNMLSFDSLHKLIRKVAHFIIYCSLGVSFYNALWQTKKNNLLAILLMTILFTMTYAFSDELHQLFIPGRNGAIADVFLDTIGGSVGGLIVYLSLKVKKEKKKYLS